MSRGRVEPGAAPLGRARGFFRVPRPSLLDHVRLSDGRLAWPVASALGMREATFRRRLNAGLSPDDAALRPVAATSGRWPGRRGPFGRLPFVGVRLSDGRPIWPAAQLAGISEATLHSRLSRGLTPDQAVSFGCHERTPEEVAVAALRQRRGKGRARGVRPPPGGRDAETRDGR